MPVFVKTATGWSKIPKGAIDVKATTAGFSDCSQVWIKYNATDITNLTTKQTAGRTITATSASKYTISYERYGLNIGGMFMSIYSDRVSNNKWNVGGSNGSVAYTDVVAPMTGVYCRAFNNPTSTGKINRVKVRFTYSFLDVTSGNGLWLGKVAPKIAASGKLYGPGSWGTNSTSFKTYSFTVSGSATKYMPFNIYYNTAPVSHYTPASLPASQKIAMTSGFGTDSGVYTGTINPRVFYTEYLHPSYWWKVPALASVEKALPALGTTKGAVATTDIWLDLIEPVEPGEKIYLYFYGPTCSSVESTTNLPSPLAFKIHEISILETNYSTPASPWGFVWDTTVIKDAYQGQWWQLGGREGVDPNGKIISAPTSREAELWGGTLIAKDIFTAKRYSRIKRVKLAVDIREAYGSWHGSGGRYWITTKEKNQTSRPSPSWDRNSNTGWATSGWYDCDIGPDETIRIMCQGNGDSGDAKVIRGCRIAEVEYAD